MTTYYLSSVDGNDTSPGTSWDDAFATFKYAVETASAAASGPHTLLVDSAHSESLSADTTITAAGNIRVLCVNRGTGALATGALVGAQSTTYLLALAGAYKVYIYGMTFKNGTDATAKRLEVNTTDGGHFELENCILWTGSTSANSYFRVAASGLSPNFFNKFTGCEFRFGTAGHSINVSGGLAEFVNCSINASYTKPTNVFGSNWGGNPAIVCVGCDWSWNATNLVSNPGAAGFMSIRMANCKLGSGVVALAAATSIYNRGQTDLLLLNCTSDDTHYALGHYDSFGETTVSASIYANDGAAYDGTNKCSWKIVTTANCSYYTPYVSPWLDAYYAGSTISPYLEALRSGSTTKYQDDEVWSEWSYQGTSGSTKATIVSDRMTPLGTAADQTASSLDASGWTGEDATNNAFMKLEAGSITPAEIGHLRARVCVGEPSITVYVDPQIRATGVTSGINRVIPTGWLQQPAAGGGLLTHPGMGGGARG